VRLTLADTLVYHQFAALNSSFADFLTFTVRKHIHRRKISMQGATVLDFLAVLLLLLGLDHPLLRSQQNNASVRTPGPASEQSRQIFASSCSGCHGLDGMGTERAPNIVTNPQVLKLSKEQLVQVISSGVPGTGMPGFRSLGAKPIDSLAAYVRVLQGKNATTPVRGNPTQGKDLFFGKAGCSSCHMVSGTGGFIAPDLSSYAQTHNAEAIKAAITSPAAREKIASLATVTTVDDQQYAGVVRNEDNFSIQLQSLDGSFHFFSRPDIKTIERKPGSMMPGDYASTLTAAQLDDIAAYLSSIERASGNSPSSDKHADDE